MAPNTQQTEATPTMKTLKQLFVIGFPLLFLSEIVFSQSIERFIDPTIEVDSLNVPIDPNQPYFPKALFPEVETDWIVTKNGITIEHRVKEGTYDELVVNWYSEHLHAMKEPLLFNRKVEKEVYRFTWLRTFDKPMTFRVEKWNDRHILYWKVLDGAGGYEPGNLTVNKLKFLTKKQWATFINLLDKANFWQMRLGRASIGNDGAEWILEGLSQTDYRVVSVWTPKGGDFYNACRFLIALSNLKIN